MKHSMKNSFNQQRWVALSICQSIYSDKYNNFVWWENNNTSLIPAMPKLSFDSKQLKLFKQALWSFILEFDLRFKRQASQH